MKMHMPQMPNYTLSSKPAGDRQWGGGGPQTAPTPPAFLKSSNLRPPPSLALITTPKKPLLHSLGLRLAASQLSGHHCFHSLCPQWFKAKHQKREGDTVLNFCFENKNQR